MVPQQHELWLLVQSLLEQGECEWIEFKHSNYNPHDLGEYISALANSAALVGRPRAYMVWGIGDADGSVKGTDFVPSRTRVGNEGLENWLTTQLDPQVHFEFHAFHRGSKSLVLLSIEAASTAPVQFKGEAYIRVGSHKKPLKKHREHERRLWRIVDKSEFENATALDHLTETDVVELLDYPAFFALIRKPLPASRSQSTCGLLERLVEGNGGAAHTGRTKNVGADCQTISNTDKGRKLDLFGEGSGRQDPTDVTVGKNYLSRAELDELGRLVNAFLDLAENQARRHIPMTMEDWATRLDGFLVDWQRHSGPAGIRWVGC